jgi:hypothetical protein
MATRTSAPLDLADVLAARQRIAPYLEPTALFGYPALDAMTGAQVWVKHENHQPVGAFKVRGGSQTPRSQRNAVPSMLPAGWMTPERTSPPTSTFKPPYATGSTLALLNRPAATRVTGYMSTLQVVLNVPIGVNEIVLAVWLIVKGFNSRATDPGHSVSGTDVTGGADAVADALICR